MKSYTKIIQGQAVLAVGLLLGRYLLAEGSYNHWAAVTTLVHERSTALAFLAWNLFLAWIPFGLSGLLPHTRHRLAGGLLLGLWLLFLPNAPYLITDFIHLRARPPVPVWVDTLLFFLFAWTGLMLGLLSLLRVHLYLRQFYQPRQAHYLIAGFILASSFGLYLGRVERWNSWDALLSPLAVLENAATLALSPPPALLLTFLFFAVLQFTGYALLYALCFSQPKKTIVP